MYNDDDDDEGSLVIRGNRYSGPGRPAPAVIEFLPTLPTLLANKLLAKYPDTHT